MSRYDHDFIINVALTGAVADHTKNSNVPIRVDDIVAQALACRQEGAAIAHFHVRDAQGRPACDPIQFGEVFGRIRNSGKADGLILCASTSGRHGQTLEQRTAVLGLPKELRPDMASLTLGSLNFVTGASINDHDTVRRLAASMLEAEVKPEFEVFDLGMAVFLSRLIEEGLAVGPFYVNILLGNLSSAAVDATQLGVLISALPADSIIAIAGIGRYQMQANMLGLAVADGARVGLEDNLWLDKHRTPATNAGLVGRLAGIARSAQRNVAIPSDVRRRLGLQQAAKS